MAKIRLDSSIAPYDGQSLTFKSPVDCSGIDGLRIYYDSYGVRTSQDFTLTDAHGENVAGIELFKNNVLVKVVLHTSSMKAYVQNADTNAYLEGKFRELGQEMSTHTHAANRITAGTFAGKVVANSSGQTPSTCAIRNSKLLPMPDTDAEIKAIGNTLSDGEICWFYE